MRGIRKVSIAFIESRTGSINKARRKPAARPRLEALEDRIALSVETWTGTANDLKWSTGGNWAGGKVPSTGDDLVFPTAPPNGNLTDDIATLSVNSIQFSDSYTITPGTGSASLIISATSGDTTPAGIVVVGNTISPNLNPTSLTFNGPTTISVQGAGSKTTINPNNLTINGDTTIDVATTTSVLTMLPETSGPTFAGTGNITQTGSGEFDYPLLQGEAYTGTVLASGGAGGKIKVGTSKKVHKVGVASGAALDISGGNTVMFDSAAFDGDLLGVGGSGGDTLQVVGNDPVGVTLSSDNPSYTGTLETFPLSHVFLHVDGDYGSSNANINSAGTLNGSGTVGALTVSEGGTVQPGETAPGTLTVIGAATFGTSNVTGNSATLDIRLTNTTSDELLAKRDPSQGVNFAPISLNNVDLNVIPNFTNLPPQGTTFTILEGDLVSGTFANVVPITPKTGLYSSGGNSFLVSYVTDSSGTVTSVQLASLNAASATTTNLATSANPSVYGQATTFTATVKQVAPGTGTPTGGVVFEDGTTVIGAGTLNGAGVATFTTSTLSVASHPITAVYVGDGQDSGSTSTPLSQVVNRDGTTTTMTSTADPSVFGQPVTFTATVAPVAPGTVTPSGSVTFRDGSTVLGTGMLSTLGVATLTTSDLAVGSHSIMAVYGGDADFATSTSSTLPQLANRSNTTSALMTSGSPSVFGQGVTFTAVVSASAPGVGTPTGAVTFQDASSTLGTAPLVNGVAIFRTTSLAVGAYSISAIYGGDADFTTSTSSLTPQAVNQASTITTASANASPTFFGQGATFTAVVSASAPGGGTPSGSVTFLDGSIVLGLAPLVDGSATFTDPSLSVGMHSITAVYPGGQDFLTSTSSAAVQQVVPGVTTIHVVSSLQQSRSGQPVTFSVVANPARGAGIPTGTVALTLNSKFLGTVTLTNGQASFTTASLPVGEDTIHLSYSGDTNFTPDTAGMIVDTVVKSATTTSLVQSSPAGSYGDTLTLVATVSPASPGAGTPTGSVTFYDGPTQLGTAGLVSGNATLSIGSLSVGSHPLTAIYDDDSNFLGSSTTTDALHSVQLAASTTVVTTSQLTTTFGQGVTFTAAVGDSVPGVTSGRVVFRDGTTVLGASPLVNGTATLATSSLSASSHAITATYEGDGFVAASTSSLIVQTVVPSSTFTLLASSAPTAAFGQTVTYTATVYPFGPGVGTPTGTMTFYEGSTVIGASRLTGGQASLSVVASGVGLVHPIRAVYAGDGNFGTDTSSVLFESVIRAQSRVLLYYQVFTGGIGFPTTILPVAPGNGAPSGSITFYANGHAIGTERLVNGMAGLFYVPLKKALNKTFYVTYSGDGHFTPTHSDSVVITKSVIIAPSRPIQAFRTQLARGLKSGRHG
jgi:hypothetical protein